MIIGDWYLDFSSEMHESHRRKYNFIYTSLYFFVFWTQITDGIINADWPQHDQGFASYVYIEYELYIRSECTTSEYLIDGISDK